jgi:hypothetical protein
MVNFMRKHIIMMGYPKCCYRHLWLAIFVLLLAGCLRTGSTVSPRSQYVLLERSLQPEVLAPHEGLWTVSFDYTFEAQTPPDSTGTLWIDSELTLLNPGVKAVRLTMYFLDIDGRVLDRATFLNIKSSLGNPIVANHQYSTPAGTAAITFTGGTRGYKPTW